MRKLVSPIADGGFPWGGEDILTVFQDDFWGALQGLLAVYDGDTQGVIVSGCIVTATSDFDITAGIVYMDGEFYRLPAQTNVPTGQHIVPGATTFTQRTFQDLGLKNFVEIKGAIVHIPAQTILIVIIQRIVRTNIARISYKIRIGIFLAGI